MSDQVKNWWQAGIESGWIGTYEKEMLRFMEREFGELSEGEKITAVFTSLFLKAGHTCLPLNLPPSEWGGILGLENSAIEVLQKEVMDLNSLKN